MTMAVSRRAVKSVPAHVASRARRSSSDSSLWVARGRRPDPRGGVLVGLALALEPAAEMPHAGEPPSGRVARLALAHIDQPAPHMPAVQLDRPDLRTSYRPAIFIRTSIERRSTAANQAAANHHAGSWIGVLVAPASTYVDMVDDDTRNSGP